MEKHFKFDFSLRKTWAKLQIWF